MITTITLYLWSKIPSLKEEEKDNADMAFMTICIFLAFCLDIKLIFF